MKITKRQLRKIIKEEKRKLLAEAALVFEDQQQLMEIVGEFLESVDDIYQESDDQDLNVMVQSANKLYDRLLRGSEAEEDEMKYAAGRPWEHN